MIFDSTTWYKAFFDNRLSKIHAGSTIDEWNHVDSANNPADFTSRGIHAHEMEKWKIFHGGLAFLFEDESKWPQTQPATGNHVLQKLHSSSQRQRRLKRGFQRRMSCMNWRNDEVIGAQNCA